MTHVRFVKAVVEKLGRGRAAGPRERKRERNLSMS